MQELEPVTARGAVGCSHDKACCNRLRSALVLLPGSILKACDSRATSQRAAGHSASQRESIQVSTQHSPAPAAGEEQLNTAEL